MRNFFLLLILCLAALVGCRTNPACERQIGLMRSELIALEDKYYILESKYREATGQGSLGGGDCDPLTLPKIDTGQPSSTPPAAPSDSDIRIQIDPNDMSNIVDPTIGNAPPRIDAAVASSDAQFRPPRIRGSRSVTDVEPAEQHSASQVDFSEIPGAQPIEGTHALQSAEIPVDDGSLKVHDVLGRDADGVAGDDGFSFVATIPLSCWSTDGVLTVSVLDPAAPHDAQRVGLWRLSGNQLGSPMSAPGDTAVYEFPLEMMWNVNQPQRGDLMLFVRWEAPGMPSCEDRQMLRIVPPRTAELDSPEPADGESSEWSPDR